MATVNIVQVFKERRWFLESLQAAVPWKHQSVASALQSNVNTLWWHATLFMVVTHKNSIKNTTQSKRGSKTSKQKLVITWTGGKLERTIQNNSMMNLEKSDGELERPKAYSMSKFLIWIKLFSPRGLRRFWFSPENVGQLLKTMLFVRDS